MIEKYLDLGVRFRWAPPGDRADHVKDGSIVESTKPSPALTYIGLGHVVSEKLKFTHVSTLGLQMNQPVQYQWLDYTLGCTARIPIGPYDVLTGFMSGCYIARWNDRGVNYVGHIGTVEANEEVNRKVKRAFAFAMPRGTTAFNPFAAWRDELPALVARLRQPLIPKVLALVTTTGQFYSVAMLKDNTNNEWYCGGSKLVPPIPHDTLKLQLIRD